MVHCSKTLTFFLLFFSILACRQSADHTIPTDPAMIEKGHQLFLLHCSACHNLQQSGIGPALGGITQQVDAAWLTDFIKQPQRMTEAGDVRAIQLFAQYKQPMPSFEHLGDTAITSLLAFLHTTSPPNTADTLAGLTNPIQDTIVLSSLILNLEKYLQLPASGEKPTTRINKMDVAANTGRVFIHDLRGQLYEIIHDRPQLYLDVAKELPAFVPQPGLGTGFGSWAFHPRFAENGLLYTTHTEPARTKPADFALPDSLPIALQWVLSEWKADRPHQHTFRGARREIMRIDVFSGIHGVQDIAFHAQAQHGDEDYGLLYVCLGDGGSVENGQAWIADHSAQRPWSSILRIDPSGSNSKNGQYSIPTGNPWANDTDTLTLGESYAIGFRNPHRLIWDDAGDLFATDIGHKTIEELNKIIPGAHYGWPEREGTFRLDYQQDMSKVFDLKPEDDVRPFTYPLVQYDHSEGGAISGGYFLKTSSFGTIYICGDIVSGRLFFTPWPVQETVAPVSLQEWRIRYKGKLTTFQDLCKNSRVDLRFGRDGQGHVFILTKADGMVYRISMAEEL